MTTPVLVRFSKKQVETIDRLVAIGARSGESAPQLLEPPRTPEQGPGSRSRQKYLRYREFGSEAVARWVCDHAHIG